MRTVEARLTPEELDAVQEARGRVPLAEFRLKKDCAYCLWLADLPANGESIIEARRHVLDEHADEVLLPT
jgi:hypothetical protein